MKRQAKSARSALTSSNSGFRFQVSALLPVVAVFLLVPLSGMLFGAYGGGGGQAPAPAETAKKSVFIRAVDLKARTITVEPMQFLTGAAAVKAYRRDHPGNANGSPPNDHYIVKNSQERKVLPLAKGAIVKLVNVGGTPHTEPVAVPEAKLAGYAGITKDENGFAAPFWITIRDGKVAEIDEQFVP
jgi:hypothetical protein